MQVRFIGCGDAFGSGARLNTCLHLTGDGLNALIDCGATSLIGLQRDAIDRNAIDTILISHFHADHFGGLPFFVLDAQLVAKRKTPLRIVGPRGVEARFRAARDVAFPSAVEPAFPLRFDEIAPGETLAFAGGRVTAFPVVHTEAAGPCLGLRIESGGKVLAFSGDSEWTEALIDVGRNADLFVCECYTRDKKVRHHLDLATLKGHLPQIAPRRVVLTHLSDDMLAARAGLPYEIAYDGFVVTL